MRTCRLGIRRLGVRRLRPPGSLAVSRMLVLALVCCGLVLAGCGFDVSEGDVFLLTRTGQGTKLTLLVGQDGTINCNGGKQRSISNALLIQARDLQEDLYHDAKRKLTIRPVAGTIFYYRVLTPSGTVAFPDRSAAGSAPLRETEQFAFDAATQACGLSG